jgi:peptidoglycan hydrolase CwlO-like protein
MTRFFALGNLFSALVAFALLGMCCAVLVWGHLRITDLNAAVEHQSDDFRALDDMLDTERFRLQERMSERKRLEAELAERKAEVTNKREAMSRFSMSIGAKNTLRDRSTELEREARQLEAEANGFEKSCAELDADLVAAMQALYYLQARGGKAEITDEAAAEMKRQYEQIISEHGKLQDRCDKVADARRKQTEQRLEDQREDEKRRRRARENAP